MVSLRRRSPCDRYVSFPVLAILAVLVVGSGAASVTASNPSTGNGAPSGPHYNLNIHGVAKGQGFGSSTGNQGHNIFVPLWGNCKIGLQAGDYQVLNSNCVTGDALFQLPNPVDNTTSNLTYSVYARALTPGSASMSACFTDTTVVPNQTLCNIGTLVVPLNKVRRQSLPTSAGSCFRSASTDHSRRSSLIPTSITHGSTTTRVSAWLNCASTRSRPPQ